MNTKAFDAKLRRVGVISRRGSLRALGGVAVIAGLSAPTAARSGKKGKNGRKRCKRQREQCRAFLEAFCEPKVDPAACVEDGHPCCEHFARCNAGTGIACLFEGVLGVAPQARSGA